MEEEEKEEEEEEEGENITAGKGHKKRGEGEEGEIKRERGFLWREEKQEGGPSINPPPPVPFGFVIFISLLCRGPSFLKY